ncbi:hypothetical protein M3Y97_00586000 [Aphelenchoides bicaudatus]|nr:hypothetical protein M3Y97_00586000 [Aphelenchoides bicaudatus]
MSSSTQDYAIISMIENIVHSEMVTELQAISGQQNKQIAEKNEARLKELREEAKRLHSQACQLSEELLQESNNLNSIEGVQTEHETLCDEAMARIDELGREFNDWLADHDGNFKTMDSSISVVNKLKVGETEPDENQKTLKNLFISAESKFMVMSGKRETIGLNAGNLVSVRGELDSLSKALATVQQECRDYEAAES